MRRPRHGAPAGDSHPVSWAPFVAAAFALFTLLLGSNLPTPLFPVYAQTYRLSPLTVTLLFATYTLLVIPALIIFGPLSDARGRREVLLPAIATASLAAGLFAIATAAWVLFLAQAVQALALGALQGTAAPTLVEHDPRQKTRRASAIASALTLGGAAAGPLLAGVLAQYAPLPLRLCYVVEVALLAIAWLLVRRRLPKSGSRGRWRPRRPTVPTEIRRRFATAAVGAFVGWAVTGLFLSLIPTFVISEIGEKSVAIAGAVVALMLGCATIVQFAGRSLQPRRGQTVGLAALLAGVIVLFAADTARSLPLLLLATVLAGAGQGLAFMSSLADVNEIAPPERRADTVASYYVVVYLGTALPVIGVGLLTNSVGFSSAVRLFTMVVAVICVLGLCALRLESRSRSPRG